MENLFTELFRKATFTRKQKEIAQYLMNHEYQVYGKTLRQIADESGSSEVSVLNFVRKLGFTGYSDFKAWIFQEMTTTGVMGQSSKQAPLSDRFDTNLRERGSGSLLQSHLSLMMSDLENSLQQNGIEKYEQAAKALIHAKRVNVMGARISGIACERFAILLQHMLPDVRYCAGVHRGVSGLIAGLGKDDVVVMTCHSRYHRKDVTICQMIKEVGATLILFCDSPLAPIAKYADYLFTTSAESISFFNSEVGITAIYEYFVTLIFDTMPEDWRQQVRDRWELDDRFFNEYRL